MYVAYDFCICYAWALFVGGVSVEHEYLNTLYTVSAKSEYINENVSGLFKLQKKKQNVDDCMPLGIFSVKHI